MAIGYPAVVLDGFVAVVLDGFAAVVFDGFVAAEAGANLNMRMAMSGQMIAQDMHAVHRPSSKHCAKGTP